MSLATPEKIRILQRKLYRKAKAEPAFRFYLLYDKICREDIFRHAYALARANAGAPGVDGMTFAAIEASGLDRWLAGLREELISKTYRPEPVRRVMIPKPVEANARSASRRSGTGWRKPPPSWCWNRSSRRTSRTVPTAIVPRAGRWTRSEKCTGMFAGVRGSGEPARVIALSNARDGLGPDPRRALGPAAIRAASTGRTRDRTRPMLQKRQKVLARAPALHMVPKAGLQRLYSRPAARLVQPEDRRALILPEARPRQSY